MSGLYRVLRPAVRILNIRIPSNKVAAILMMLALMMPIAMPIPVWAYSLNLPPMTDDSLRSAATIASLPKGLLNFAKSIPEEMSAFLTAPTETEKVVVSDKKVKSRKNDNHSAPASSGIDDVDDNNNASEAVDEEIGIPSKATAKSAIVPAPLVVNQLPEDERESVYTHENNLGSPPGQVEADSSNIASTTRIKHRAGIGNFSFGIPLASLSGRGIDAGVGMTYNSRTWNKSCSQYTGATCTQNHFTYDVEQSWIAPGFSSGFGHLSSRFVTRNVVMMDGSDTEVRPLTEVLPEGITDPDGTRRQISCKTIAHIPGGHSSAFYCSAFQSNDGSVIRVFRNGPNYSIGGTVNYSNISFSVVYPNGSKVYYSNPFGSGNTRKHYPLIVQDSNGNRIRITYMPDQSGRIDYITDTLNRKIKFYYENDANGNPDKLVAVTIPGMGQNEEIQTVRFYYTQMMLEPGGFSGNPVVTAPAIPIDVLLYAYFPATKTGFKYIYHPKYGMIKDIVRFTGMQVSTTSTTQTGEISYEGTFAASTQYNFPEGNSADVPKYTKRTDEWTGRTSAQPQETYYHFPEGAGQTSVITVKGDNLDITTENTTDASGMIMETSVKERTGPEQGGERPFAKLMSRNKYTWAPGGRYLAKLETTNESGLTKATEFEYDQYGNQTKAKEYGYAVAGTLGTLLRTTETTYEGGTGWINANLFGLAKEVKTIVGGVTVSKTLLKYDHNGSDATITPRNDIDTSTHSTFYNPAHPEWWEEVCPFSQQGSQEDGCVIIYHPGYSEASAFRGNLTQVARMLDVNAATADDQRDDVTEYDYDIAGNLVSATLSCCNVKTIAYSKDHEYAFPVSETKGTSLQLVNSATYNRNTGLMLTSTNENGQTTVYEYEPDTLRPTKTIFPNGGETLAEYSDKVSPGTLPGFVRQTTTLDAGKNAVSYSYFDGRGLGTRSATQTPDGWSISAVEYDRLGQARKSYNPFYGATPLTTVPGGTAFTDMTKIDAFGRPTEVTLQDGTKVLTKFSDLYDFQTLPAGFNKTFVTLTDQAGKQRRQLADALGRIVRLDEPDANGDLGAVDAPTQPTVYEYDSNDNLSKVIQSDGTATQERRFKYDALSRLTHEKQVEANATLDDNGVKGAPDPATKWTKFLKYKPDGLLDYGIDARGVRTTFGYDGLNRVTGITYTGETGYTTPNVTYTYDLARSGHFNTGALTRVETAAVGDTPATATEFDYDLMGRVVKHRQSIGTQTYNLEYGYNLAGQLITEKYPSGKIVTTSYDANGRLASIADGQRTFANNFQYQQYGGALSGMTLGNGTTETFTLNDRMQLASQNLLKGADVLQKYDYGYGELDPQSVLRNNGKLESVVSHIGSAKQWTQKFKYDSIGRLSESEEKRGDTNALTYKQNFDFDRFGNMYRKATNNNPTGQENPLPYTPIEESDISKTSNRFTTETTYDDAGNVVADNKFRDMSFSYDANGRMIKAIKTGVPDARTAYDALGNRVATNINDLWQYMIYDAFGQLVAEYGTDSQADGITYIQQDWQGSVRTTTTNAGFVASRTDHQAFGEDIGAGTGLRTTQQGYGVAPAKRQGYGLTEKDEATGLNHTWFRKNENQAGRWTSPDPYNGSMSLGNPQSFNRYSYVQNQPTNFIDPSGLFRAAPRAGCVAEYVNGEFRRWNCPPLTIPGGTTGTWDDPDPTTGWEEILTSGGDNENDPSDKKDETFNDCVKRKVTRALKDARKSLENIVGAAVVGTAFGVLTAVLIAALVEPSQIGKVAVGAVAGIGVAATIAALFAHKDTRDTLRSKIEETLEDCKGKPGTPENLPSADEIMKVFETGLG